MNNKQLIAILQEIYQEVLAQKTYLNDLDQAIGDGDHGTNVVRGFETVVASFPSFENLNPKNIMKQVAMILMSKIGGSSGPLLGTLALQISGNLTDEDTNSLEQWIQGLEKGSQAIAMLGKSAAGDKTMLDALIPAIEGLKAGNGNLNSALEQAANNAKKGSDDTKPLEAKKGRASYLGPRSIDHIDPGSVTISIFFNSARKVLNHG